MTFAIENDLDIVRARASAASWRATWVCRDPPAPCWRR